MPHPITTAVARLLRSFASRLPLAPAVKGNVSDDPRVEAEFYGPSLSHLSFFAITSTDLPE